MRAAIWDVFISHASENQAAFVRPLAAELQRRGLSVWYDEFSLRAGDSLRESIDRGLAHSWHGVIIVSKAFIAKPWTNWETNGLVQTCLGHASRRLIPVWYDIGSDDVAAWSPALADIKAVVERDPRRAADVIWTALKGDDVLFYRELAKENDFNVQIIQGSDAAIRLLCDDPKDVIYALYRVERRRGSVMPSLRQVTSLHRDAIADFFYPVVAERDVETLLGLREDYPVLTPNDPSFSALIDPDGQSTPTHAALLLLALPSNSTGVLDDAQAYSVQLVLAILAPSPAVFRRDARELADVALLLGSMFQPFFRPRI
ncbi:MAG TPA: toll/interleukin-1 receptor domain-containing protein [Thermoanaerobaculia bacterium]|nr:toll/interleukin-1 receptor domain-containing protein [Thermoanaerobaculia bacterium]